MLTFKIPQSEDRPPAQAVNRNGKLYLGNQRIKWNGTHWVIRDQPDRPLDDNLFWIRQKLGRVPNGTFPWKGRNYVQRHEVFFNTEVKRWYILDEWKNQRFLADELFEGEFINGDPRNALPTDQYEEWQTEQFAKQKPVTSAARRAVFTPIKSQTPTTLPQPLPSSAPTPASERSLSLPGLERPEDTVPTLSPLQIRQSLKGKVKAEEQEQEDTFDDAPEEPEPKIEFLKDPEYQPRDNTTGEGSSHQEPPTYIEPQFHPAPQSLNLPLPVSTQTSSQRPASPPDIIMANPPQQNHPHDRFKFPEPKEFNGKKRNAEIWILKIDEYFRSPGVTMQSDRDRVRYALFRIGDEAEDWANSELRKYKADNDTHWPTWAEFQTAFQARWGESNVPAKALKKLKDYKWKAHANSSIGEILTTVDTLIQESKITDEDQKKAFLADALSNEHRKFLAFTRPQTYGQALTAITEYEVEMDRSSYSGGRSQQRDPNAMDVDRVKINQFSKTKENDTCNRCGKKGHWAKDCFVKTGKPAFKSKFKGKKKFGKFKKYKKGGKKFIRGVNAETDDEQESSEEEDSDEEAEEVSINKVKTSIDQMDLGQRKQLWKALQKDF